MPIVVCLLFLMAVAPVLPWRKASAELLRYRLLWPATAGVATLVVCVAAGVRGLNPLLAFGLGAFAAASALRQLVLATRRQGARGFVGRANGGMIVHLGIIMIAVAFAASHSFQHTGSVTLRPGVTRSYDGHQFTYLGIQSLSGANRVGLGARIRLDGGKVYTPAVNDYQLSNNQEVPTPAIRSTAADDVYLTLNTVPPPQDYATGSVTIGIIIEPLVSWLWVGGGVVVAGSALSAFPGGRRRKPTDPVSGPVGSAGRQPDEEPLTGDKPAPVGASLARTCVTEPSTGYRVLQTRPAGTS